MIQGLSPEEIRRVTEGVLKEPEFQKSLDWWSLLLDAFREFLRRVSGWAFENPDMARTLLIVLSVVLALLLVHIGYTVGREFTSMRRRSAAQAAQSRPLQALDAFQLHRYSSTSHRFTGYRSTGCGPVHPSSRSGLRLFFGYFSPSVSKACWAIRRASLFSRLTKP